MGLGARQQIQTLQVLVTLWRVYIQLSSDGAYWLG
jgi:hypothetical protein